MHAFRFTLRPSAQRAVKNIFRSFRVQNEVNGREVGVVNLMRHVLSFSVELFWFDEVMSMNIEQFRKQFLVT